MALSIKDPEADRLAREVAQLTGETLTQAVITALAERRDRIARRRDKPFVQVLRNIEQAHQLPILDHRSEDEILGYDETGVPTQ